MDCSSVFPRHLPSCMCLEFHLLGPDPCPSQDMHRPHLTRSIVAPFLEQEQVLKKLFYPIVNFFCWHLLICTGLTSVRPTYKFVICFDTKIFLSGTKEEIPCDHFLVTMSLLRLFIDSDVWGKRNSFLVGEVGSVDCQGAPRNFLGLMVWKCLCLDWWLYSCVYICQNSSNCTHKMIAYYCM